MSGRFKRFPYKSLKGVIDTDNKNVEVFESNDGSVTVVKKEEIRKNYRYNKLIKNDEDAKIIQDFCRKYLHYNNIINEKNIEEDKKEQESQNTMKGGYFSKYRRNFKKQEENENSNKSPKMENIINENSEKYNNTQIKQNEEEQNKGRKLYRRGFLRKAENSNENESQEKNSSYKNNINITSVKNDEEEYNNSIRYKRKIINSEGKNDKKEEEKKPKFLPTYHEKKRFVQNDSQLDNKNYSNLKNYKCQEIEVIPVKIFDDYDYNSRMRYLSPIKPLYVQPFLNPDIIITKIKFDDNYIQQSNIGYSNGIYNNVNYYRNDNLYKNKNPFGREISKSQYKSQYNSIHPFSNIDNPRKVNF